MMDAFESRLLRSLVEQFEAECLRNKVSASSHHQHVAEAALAMVLRSQGGAILMGQDLYRCDGSRVIVHRSIPDLSPVERPALN